MLEAQGLTRTFGGIQAVRDCSLSVAPGEIVGLIGPNGAGKSTAFNLIAGSLAPDRGRIVFDGTDITRLRVDTVSRLGLVRTFQIPQPFSKLTVLENLLVAAPRQRGEQFWGVWISPGTIRKQERRLEGAAREILDFLRLGPRANQLAGTLSGGQKKLLELGRALMTGPRLILLDEPVAGVAPKMRQAIADRVSELRSDGMTFLIVEHRMDFIMSISDRLYVMAEGTVLMDGTPTEVQQHDRVLRAYLGVG